MPALFPFHPKAKFAVYIPLYAQIGTFYHLLKTEAYGAKQRSQQSVRPPDFVAMYLGVVITWVGLGLRAAEPHAP